MTRLNAHSNPAVVRVLVIWIVGHIELVFGKIKPLRASQKLVSPLNRFITEIIADREVAQHFKHSMVAGSLSDIFNIVGPNGLLSIGNPRILWNNGSVKVFLEGCYTRINPEQGWIVDRHQADRRFYCMTFTCPKIQPHLTNLST